jgi:hypothetical protein
MKAGPNIFLDFVNQHESKTGIFEKNLQFNKALIDLNNENLVKRAREIIIMCIFTDHEPSMTEFEFLLEMINTKTPRKVRGIATIGIIYLLIFTNEFEKYLKRGKFLGYNNCIVINSKSFFYSCNIND